MSRRRRVHAIYWHDIQADAGWGLRVCPWPCVTVGFIVKRPTKRKPWYRIADTIGRKGGGGATAIPAGCVERVEDLGKVRVP